MGKLEPGELCRVWPLSDTTRGAAAPGAGGAVGVSPLPAGEGPASRRGSEWHPMCLQEATVWKKKKKKADCHLFISAYTSDVVLAIQRTQMLVCVLSDDYFADSNAVFVLESGVQVDLHIMSWDSSSRRFLTYFYVLKLRATVSNRSQPYTSLTSTWWSNESHSNFENWIPFSFFKFGLESISHLIQSHRAKWRSMYWHGMYGKKCKAKKANCHFTVMRNWSQKIIEWKKFQRNVTTKPSWVSSLLSGLTFFCFFMLMGLEWAGCSCTRFDIVYLCF